MADDYTTVPGGVLLVAVIVFWAWALNALGYYVPAVERMLRPPKLPLIRAAGQ